jgi:hypothetical protein
MTEASNKMTVASLLQEVLIQHEIKGKNNRLSLKEIREEIYFLLHPRGGRYSCSQQHKDMIENNQSLGNSLHRLKNKWASPNYLPLFDNDVRRCVLGTQKTGYCLARIGTPIHKLEIQVAAEKAIKREKGSARNRQNQGQTAAQNMILSKDDSYYLLFGTEEEIAKIRARYEPQRKGFLAMIGRKI